MSKKQILKRGFAILTVITLICVTLSVSAAPSISTSTTYVMGSQSVSVTSTVSGVNQGDQITYLAYDTDKNSGVPVGGTESNIIYIDQKAAGTNPDPANTAVFSYTTAISKIGSTLVKFGAAETVISQPQTNTINTYTVTTEVLQGTGTISASGIATGECQFTITPGTGEKLAAIVRDDGVPAPVIGGVEAAVIYTTIIDKDLKISVSFDPIDATGDDSISDGVKFTALTNLTDNKLSTFSTAKIHPNQKEFEYGIVFYYDEAYNSNDASVIDEMEGIITGNWGKNVGGTIPPFNATYNSENQPAAYTMGVNKYRSLGKGSDGKFAVLLHDADNHYFNRATKYYTRPYLAIKTGADTYNIKFGKFTEYSK